MSLSVCYTQACMDTMKRLCSGGLFLSLSCLINRIQCPRGPSSHIMYVNRKLNTADSHTERLMRFSGLTGNGQHMQQRCGLIMALQLIKFKFQA